MRLLGMTIFGERLKKARLEAGMTQIELGKLVGVKPPTISEAESIGLSSTKTLQYAKALKVNPEWLATGKGKMNLEKNAGFDDNTEPSPNINGSVPIISWVQAGSFNECIDDLGECEQIATDVKVKSHTFALRVTGDSMLPQFTDGMIIVVEPEMHPESGDFVIAKNGDNEATFKQLIKDGQDWYLKPLNERYPIKPLGTSNIIGVIRQAIVKFR